MDHTPKLKHKNIKFLEDNTGQNLGYFGLVMTFQIQQQKHNPRNKETDQLYFIKIKNFCSAKDVVREKTRHTEEQIFAKDESDKRQLPKIYEEVFNTTKRKHTIKNR